MPYRSILHCTWYKYKYILIWIHIQFLFIFYAGSWVSLSLGVLQSKYPTPSSPDQLYDQTQLPKSEASNAKREFTHPTTHTYQNHDDSSRRRRLKLHLGVWLKQLYTWDAVQDGMEGGGKVPKSLYRGLPPTYECIKIPIILAWGLLMNWTAIQCGQKWTRILAMPLSNWWGRIKGVHQG